MRSTCAVLASALLLSTANGQPVETTDVQQPTEVLGYAYSGCFTEPSNARALSASSYVDDLMTLEKCAVACSSFNVFGVEYGRECWCGNALNSGSLMAPENDCNFSCPGNSSQICGAGNRLNVYTKPSSQPTSTTSTAPAPTSTSTSQYEALGCYTEGTKGHALDSAIYYDDAMTIDKCEAVCSAYTYFGVEYGRECYCGNTLGEGSGPTQASECSFTCPGNSAQFCGAGSRLSLYKKKTAAPTSTSTVPSVTSTTSSEPTETGVCKKKKRRTINQEAQYECKSSSVLF
ncbi:WSC domain-containing protein [Bisporella sp. PMI_857]|nr:WSC domain-containing protein [Bisporella sp. PMI_857]